MHTFRDLENREWKIDLNCDVIETVLAETNTNLLDLLDKDSPLLQEIAQFPPVVCKLIAATIREQLVTAGLDDKQFRRAMNGETLAQASDALLDELVLFSPQHSRRLRAAVLEKHREVQAATMDMAMARIEDPLMKEQLLAAADRRIERDMREALASLEQATEQAGHPCIHGSGSRESEPAAAPATASSPTAGTPPDSSVSLPQDLSPGESSAASPTDASPPSRSSP
jgi:hypothetical protein